MLTPTLVAVPNRGFVTGGKDATVKLWDPALSQTIQTYDVEYELLRRLAITVVYDKTL